MQSELGRLKNLESLILESNDLSAQLPSELGNLTRIRHEIVNGHFRLSGAIPDDFKLLTDLQFFRFHDTNIVGNVNGLFCGDNGIVYGGDTKMIGDCLENPPGVICDCCAVCCEGSAIHSGLTFE